MYWQTIWCELYCGLKNIMFQNRLGSNQSFGYFQWYITFNCTFCPGNNLKIPFPAYKKINTHPFLAWKWRFSVFYSWNLLFRVSIEPLIFALVNAMLWKILCTFLKMTKPLITRASSNDGCCDQLNDTKPKYRFLHYK